MDQCLGERQLVQQVDQGHNEGATQADGPQRHRAAAQGDAHAAKLRLLPVERDTIGELGGDEALTLWRQSRSDGSRTC